MKTPVTLSCSVLLFCLCLSISSHSMAGLCGCHMLGIEKQNIDSNIIRTEDDCALHCDKLHQKMSSFQAQ
ncbi:MAG: hypothetical protein H0U75_02210 [Legionella sp.]|nr:hypothetical protein [Legionella sp.]